MKFFSALAVLAFLFSCSPPSVNEQKPDLRSDTSLGSQSNNIIISQPDTVPHPSEAFQKFIAEAGKQNFLPVYPGIYKTSDRKNYFSLADPARVFAAYENMVMMRTKNAGALLQKKTNKGAVRVGVEEWLFADETEARNIENALTRPLKDKTEMRFTAEPFTFFRQQNRIYYLHTDAERNRAEMDKLNDLLTTCLTPAQVE